MTFRLPPLFSTETVPMRLVLTVLFLLFAFSATALAHESPRDSNMKATVAMVMPKPATAR